MMLQRSLSPLRSVLFLFCLCSAQEDGPPSEVGLFVTVQWRKLTPDSAAIFEACDAESCAREGCVPQVSAITIEGECMPRADSNVTEITGSRVYQYSEDTDQLSIDVFFEGNCQGDSANDPLLYDLGTCTDENPYESDQYYLPNFCISSPTPVGPFVSPLIDSFVYGSEEACEAQSDVRMNRFFPADPTYCIQSAVPTENGTVSGSFKHYCASKSDEFVYQEYSDPECSKVSDDLLFPISVNEGCYVPPEVPLAPGADLRMRTPCDSPPRYHCKDLSEAMDIVTRITERDEEDSDMSANSGDISSYKSRFITAASTIVATLFLFMSSV